MNFMGHSEKIHKSIYQQPDIDKDMFVMPKVLNFISRNNAISSSDANSVESTIESKEISKGAVEDPHTLVCRNIKGKNAKAAKKRSRSDITQEYRFKISAMSQAKIELAHVQMDAIKQEIDLKKKEFNLKKCILNMKINEK
ncbi:hypothetical protein JTB14_021767 [Gonioctena quinquepunctata]|nr:hypothetical protein JTB14_021767 [Gonioctena quinquepunctata]